MPEDGPLTALAIQYQCDKWGPHSYTPHYEAHFAPYRDRAINFLEIGIGGYEDPESGGRSLKMWTTYFSRARIFALDIHDKSAHATDRVSVWRGSQSDPRILHAMHAASGGFDVVIDDGSHMSPDVIATFQILFPLLKDGGLYVVEDTQTSYWPVLKGSSINPDSTATTMGFFKSLIHGLNHAEMVGAQPPTDTFARTVKSLHFYHNIVMIGKGDNTEPSNVPADFPLRAESDG
jgi:hypothetical protein